MSAEDIHPKALVFDWDSTLVDNWPCIERALNATFAAFDRPQWTSAQVRAGAKASLRNTFPKLFGEDRWEDAMALFYDRFEAFHLEALAPLPGAEGLLEYLTEQQIRMSLVSNKTGRYLRLEAEHLGWSGYFDHIIGATDAEHDKPAPDPVHMALAGTGIQPGPEVWFVGDTGVDLQCAHASGCVPVLVVTGSISAEERELWPPRHAFDDLSQIVKFLKSR